MPQGVTSIGVEAFNYSNSLTSITIPSSVKIGDGTIIGTRAVVTKDVLPYTIVGGLPAKEIRKRFNDDIINKLLELKRWDWSIEKIKKNIEFIRNGDLEKIID